MKSPSEEGETAPGSFTGVEAGGVCDVVAASLLLLLSLPLLLVLAAVAVGEGVEPIPRTTGW